MAIEIKGIGEHTIKEKTSFQRLIGLLASAETHLQNENYQMADINLQVIDSIFPEENKTPEYQQQMNIIETNWKNMDAYLTKQILHSNRYLEMTDYQRGIAVEFSLYVMKKYKTIQELFIKNKLYELEPREYEA